MYRTSNPAEAGTVLGDYERHNRWAAPVICRVLTWLVGWDYDGCPGARERLVHELPLVAFRPRDAP